MEFLFCILIGYGIGMINPAYIIGKLKGLDIRKQGSKNAGASNALILFGKSAGILCALFDIAKATLAIILAKKLFPHFMYAMPVTGVAATLGHMFPFYMKFKGGKGLACLGGVVFAYNWRLFLMLLAAEIVIVLITDYICFVPMTASVAFPIIYGVIEKDLLGALVLTLITVAVFIKHTKNIIRITQGKEMHFSFLWNKDKEVERMIQARQKQDTERKEID